ncbi:hypothetical protein [Kutzneria sp. 744]|uniref:hypothetical protein n=1 Tax=Kutzneria sp. (strain 744) TaxID=345341 RepID=UPI0003EEC1A8|nr:hypothetical protein [Kutzneria sp. 744]EWM16426.1 hypothetical protein KUTG_06730 [Kutzneria sp. 744]
MSHKEEVVDRVLIDTTVSAVVEAPLDRIDLGTWLRGLSDEEYRQCAVPDHRANGWSTNADGQLVSINVEEIGGELIIQHYVAEVLAPHHTRLVSLSELQTPGGWGTVEVVWDITVTALGPDRATFTNRVVSRPTRSLLKGLEDAGVTFEQASAERTAVVAEHNALETPNYAKSVERAVLAGN